MSLGEEIHKRIFIVGAARSGTTLLQSMISTHSQIYSFPETHFFSGTIPYSKWKRFIWNIRPKNKDIIKNYLTKIKENNLIIKLDDYLPSKTLSTKRWGNGLLKILDDIAINKGYKIWVEKTPLHLRYIDIIGSLGSNIIFVHIIRKGEDVVASTYEVTHKYSNNWGGSRSIKQCIERWKEDINISKYYLGANNHKFIFYEELIESPDQILKNLFSQINLPYEKSILRDYKKEASKLIFKEELWKYKAQKKIQKSNKFENIFTKEQKKYIKNEIEIIDLSIFNKYKL